MNIDRNVNIDADRNFNKWEHNSYHRRGVKYENDAVRNKFAKGDTRPADRKLDYRGRSGEQIVKPGKGDGKPGGPTVPISAVKATDRAASRISARSSRD